MAKASTETKNLAAEALQQLTVLAGLLKQAEADVEKTETEFKAAKERARVLREEDIPAFMTEIGMTMLALEDGTVVQIASDVFAGITKEKADDAFGWLEEHGFGGLVKSTLTLVFQKAQLETSYDVAAELLKMGYEPEITRGVHAGSLKAFLREQLAKGTDIPLELFGARPVKVAKLKEPKAKTVEE